MMDGFSELADEYQQFNLSIQNLAWQFLSCMCQASVNSQVTARDLLIYRYNEWVETLHTTISFKKR